MSNNKSYLHRLPIRVDKDSKPGKLLFYPREHEQVKQTLSFIKHYFLPNNEHNQQLLDTLTTLKHNGAKEEYCLSHEGKPLTLRLGRKKISVEGSEIDAQILLSEKADLPLFYGLQRETEHGRVQLERALPQEIPIIYEHNFLRTTYKIKFEIPQHIARFYEAFFANKDTLKIKELRKIHARKNHPITVYENEKNGIQVSLDTSLTARIVATTIPTIFTLNDRMDTAINTIGQKYNVYKN